MIKQLRPDDPPSAYRLWYNARLPGLKADRVLDIGKGIYWDYSALWDNYATLDIDPERKPSIVADITRSGLPSESYGLILCNGMYEYVVNAPAMVREVFRLLRPGGTALFGFAGLDYPAPRAFRFHGDASIFAGFEITEQKHFGREYHFYLCNKPCQA